MLTSLARGLQQLVYPATCAHCRALIAATGVDFCPACKIALVSDPHHTCPRCSSTVGEHTDVAEGCGRCRGERYHFESCSRLGLYEGPLRDAILAIKYGQDETLGECLGRLWVRHQADRFRSLGVDLVIPVPLHWWRRLRRGFDQSACLSAAVATNLGCEHRPAWLRRRRWTKSQVDLAPTVRRENVRGAFAASRSARLAGRRILLIDDVVTTGATASEAARVLRIAGASAVHLAVLAHR